MSNQLHNFHRTLPTFELNVTVFEILGNVKVMIYQENKYCIFVKFHKCAETVSKPSNYPSPFPESCGKVVCKIIIQQPHSRQGLRICFTELYVFAGMFAGGTVHGKNTNKITLYADVKRAS